MASLLKQLDVELTPEVGRDSAPPGHVARSDSVFALANAVSTPSLLDRYGIEHDGKHARCPGCGESGALICERGGLKCLHNRCSHVGPPNHRGLRTNVDLVAERESVEPRRAAELICEWFGVPRPAPLPRSEAPQTEWCAPIPLGAQLSTTPFPIEALPAPLRTWVEAEALATQTPPDLAAVVALAAISACVAKKVEVEIRPGWREPLNTYWLVALEPGNRKSAVFRDAVAPLHRCEKETASRLGAPAKAGSTRQLIHERRLKLAIAEAARSGSARDYQIAEELAVEGDSARVNAEPRLVVDDVTPERLSAMLAEQGGRLAIMSAEGGLFELAGGRYADGIPNLDVFLKSHPGDDLRVDRVGRAPIHIRKPALTLGLAVQPEIIRDLSTKRGFRGSGLLARFFYALPQSLVGRRQVSPPPVPAPVSIAYDRLCASLLAIPEQRDADGELIPTVISFDADACTALERFACRLEPRLGNGGDLASLSDWANKLVGGIARIAALLHLVGNCSGVVSLDELYPDSGYSGNLGNNQGLQSQEAFASPVCSAAVASAIALGDYLLDHALAAFALMGADPDVDHAQRLLAWIERTGTRRFSKRDAWQATRGYFKKASDLDAPLLLLREHGYVREELQERAGPGRKPSAVFLVSPNLQPCGVQP